jgi:hypothetical protein
MSNYETNEPKETMRKALISSDELSARPANIEKLISSSDLNHSNSQIRFGHDRLISSSDLPKKSNNEK